ncbi:hypothetical protein HW555_011730 [Spodoptera exigua]|uniref:Spaetzle domain-containing protein n=1 Tax=Spodoptera exigua TaxID=7107 RepID=A0A835G804_SPOEX|nr:hypothetical protein HW555_011730 [Spodoptera exigua]
MEREKFCSRNVYFIYTCLQIAVLISFSKSMGNPIEIAAPSSLLRYGMPAACKNQTFCFEKGDNYPDDLVEQFLKAIPLQNNLGSRIGFSFRGGDEENGNADCPANTTYVDKPIYYIVDEMGMVRVVIQSPKKFEQIYSTRWCLNPGVITKNTAHFFPESLTFKKVQLRCETSYMDLDFMVLVDDYDQPTYEVVKALGGIPVCYQMPEACIGQSYCFEKGDHYPDDIMQKLNLNFEIQNSIGTRKGSDVDEPDCPSNSTDSPIYYIVDKNDIIRVVVQIPDKFPQRFNVRWCLNEGKINSDTKHFMASTTLKKYDVECVSSKLEFDFIVLSLESDDKIEIATTNLPVCCKCRYELKKN